MEQKQRPIILEIDDAKQELVQCVNNIMQTQRLSCYLLEPIFAELYSQIKASAQNELATARANEVRTQGAEGTE
jgi:methionyl-tRNA synthetase